jgi:hypothetical protein
LLLGDDGGLTAGFVLKNAIYLDRRDGGGSELALMLGSGRVSKFESSTSKLDFFMLKTEE